MTELKKGNISWKPASLNNFTDMEPGKRYRQIRKDATNLAKKEQEGWQLVSGVESPSTEYEDPNRIEHGKPLTSVLEGHDWIMGWMPEEMAQAREEYFQAKTKAREAGLRADVNRELAKDGAMSHGEITISSRKGTQTT